MKISKLSVDNYKSLRKVSWYPGQLSAIVGANASGKSNLAEVHDFLSDIYRHGLSVAVARKGGYENIAHRKMRRSRGDISIELVVELGNKDRKARRSLSPYNLMSLFSQGMRFTHAFSFKAESAKIKSGFRISKEDIVLEYYRNGKWIRVLEIRREKNNTINHRLNNLTLKNVDQRRIFNSHFRFLKMISESQEEQSVSPTELIMSSIGRFIPILRDLSDQLGQMRVFRLSPTDTRKFGVPIPNPEMTMFGENLPAVVDMIFENYPGVWANIMSIMRQLLPGLEEIEAQYTDYRTLGLNFKEKGVGRPWIVAEISDGTIHSLAFLVALFDPRTKVLVIEEPENSVHTWILRTLMDAAREASSAKQIVLTTHSRVVVDAVEPRDVWIMWREKGESNLFPLNAFSDEVIEMIEDGNLTTFEILDTGVITEALPPVHD